MGNQQQQAKEWGGAFIKLDSDVIVPNKLVSGTIYLHVKKNYPSTELVLNVFGYEQVHIIQTLRRERQKPTGLQVYYEFIDKREKDIFLDSQVKIYDWTNTGSVKPGQYSFPFKFLLPDGLPGSFYYKRNKAFGEICYQIYANLRPLEENKVPQIHYLLNVQVRESLKKPVEPAQSNFNSNFGCCLCLNNGSVQMNTYFEKDALIPDEDARIAVEIDCSKLKTEITDVSYELRHNIVLSAQDYKFDDFHYPARCSLGSIKAGETWVGDQKKFATMKLPPQDPRNPNEIDEDKTDLISFRAKQDNFISPSVKSKLITSSYELGIVCYPGGLNCCGTNPKTTIPVQIYNGPFKLKHFEAETPAGWSPQIMQTTNVVVKLKKNDDGSQEAYIDQAETPNSNQKYMIESSLPTNQGVQKQSMINPSFKDSFQGTPFQHSMMQPIKQETQQPTQMMQPVQHVLQLKDSDAEHYEMVQIPN